MTKTLTTIEKTGLKKRLMLLCTQLIEQRITAISAAMDNAQANANAEEKSSAGDKYETSRAMSHLEKDMQSRQLAANQIELANLFKIDCSEIYDSPIPGSYIRCQECSFFIASGLGKVQFEGETIYLLSPGAPLAKLLFPKKRGSVFSFNKTEMNIEDIF